MIEEILVHISTPATRSNDLLYRSLAESYLDFEPQRVQGVGPRPELLDRNNASNQSQPLPQLGTISAELPNVSLLSNDRDSYGSFPSHLSSNEQRSFGEAADDFDSIAPSSRLAQLDQIHQRWKDQTAPISYSVNASGYTRRTSNALDRLEPGFFEDTQLAAEALQSQLQSSNSSTFTDFSEDDLESETRLIKNPTPKLNSWNHSSSNDKEASRTVHSAQLSGFEHDSHTNQPILSAVDRILDIGLPAVESDSSELEEVSDELYPMEDLDFGSLPVDAFPPMTKISVDCPGRLPCQVTKHLAAVKAQNPKRFQCSKQTYVPKLDDRGYWSLNCSAWPRKLQYDFWIILCEYAHSGKLGWGVTLHRDASHPQVLGPVRVYCWAEIVEHIWLCLWLCSNGRIAGSSSSWFDADGTVVFEVS